MAIEQHRRVHVRELVMSSIRLRAPAIPLSFTLSSEGLTNLID